MYADPIEPQMKLKIRVYPRRSASGFVLERTDRTSCELHTTMELHACVSKWEGSRLTLWDSTQGVFDIREALAACLRLPLSGVRVISQYMGRGFGSKAELDPHQSDRIQRSANVNLDRVKDLLPWFRGE